MCERSKLQLRTRRVCKELFDFLNSNLANSAPDGSEHSPALSIRNLAFSEPEELQAACEASPGNLEHQLLNSLRFVDDAAPVRTVLRIHVPEGYPFEPFNIYVDECDDGKWLRRQLLLACPEVAEWRGDALPLQPSSSLLGSFRSFLLSDFRYLINSSGYGWSLSYTMRLFLERAFARLRALSFPQAVDSILTTVRLSEVSPSRKGTVTLLIGTAGEPPPNPTSDERVIILIDPYWMWFATAEMIEDGMYLNGLVSWTRDNALYVCLAAPYCSGDTESEQAMKHLLLQLFQAGWRKLMCYVSKNVHVELPLANVTWQSPYVEDEACSWEGVPAVLRRNSPGRTHGRYLQK